MILLTGASGYLGRQVLANLEERGLPYMATSRSGHVGTACDLLDYLQVVQLMDRVRPSMVIHCAALVPKKMEDYQDMDMALRSAHMVGNLNQYDAPMVLASSLTVTVSPRSVYAQGKAKAEKYVKGRVVMRLPGLFGAERQNGRIYNHAKDGSDYGTEPAMHVEDAAEYLVRAATMPSDGSPEPFSVVYGNPRLVATYGDIPHTLQSRVQALVEQVREPEPPANVAIKKGYG